MYQQPGDPNQPYQGPYYPPNNPQWPDSSPGYAPQGYPPGTDQPSYAPPPPTYYAPPYPQDAPTYNSQGAQPYGYPGGPGYMPPVPPRKSNTRLFIIIAAVLIAVIVIAGFGVALGHQAVTNVSVTPTSSTGNTPSTANTTPSTGANTPTSGNTPTTVTTTGNAKVGQTVQAGANYAVTVNSVRTSTGDTVFQPKAGNIYIVIDVTVKNTSSSSQVVSSFINFELQDSTGQKYTEAFTDIGTPPDETALQPGKLIRGQLIYEVPTSMHQFTMSFNDLLGDGSLASWDITD
jgi:Domain of unknown function (DUF4352)